jgi:hypothetical protein
MATSAVGLVREQNCRVFARGVFSLNTFFGQAKKVLPSADTRRKAM